MAKIKECKKPGLKGEPHYLENISDHYIQKFYDRCEHQDNGCIYIGGVTQNNGYKNWWYVYYNNQNERITRYITAHRFAALISGKFPQDKFNEYSVLHNCDANYDTNDITYRQCVNPDHLWLGTVQDNIKDCIAKGRYVKPPRLIGEQNNNATITEKQALFIIENHKKITQRELAEIVNCSRSTVESIHRNITWRHLPR